MGDPLMKQKRRFRQIEHPQPTRRRGLGIINDRQGVGIRLAVILRTLHGLGGHRQHVFVGVGCQFLERVTERRRYGTGTGEQRAEDNPGAASQQAWHVFFLTKTIERFRHDGYDLLVKHLKTLTYDTRCHLPSI